MSRKCQLCKTRRIGNDKNCWIVSLHTAWSFDKESNAKAFKDKIDKILATIGEPPQG